MRKQWLKLAMGSCLVWWTTSAIAQADDKEEHAKGVIENLGGHIEFFPRGQLYVLHLQGTDVSDADLKEVGKLKNVAGLFLSDTKVTDEGIKWLSAIESLNALDVSHTKITGKGLKDLKMLITLNLARTRITDDGLKELSESTRLRVLNLENTAVTDEGLKELEQLKHLKRLFLGNTKVTQAGIKALQRALPQCIIDKTVEERFGPRKAALQKPPLVKIERMPPIERQDLRFFACS